MGYTLALVPTLIKLSTIHSLMRAGEHFQRADIDKHKFKKVMATTWIILVLYLTIWTIFDIPSPKKNYYESRDGENTMVTVNEYTGCASRSDWWEIFSIAFEGMILVATTILTYFCRSAIEELNESRSLSFVVYSHFLFLIMRLLMFSLMSSEILTNALYIRIVSLLITSDTLVAVCVYFFPKFYMVVTTSKFFQKGLSWRNDIHLKHRGNRKTTSTSSNSRYRTINGIRMPEGKY